MKRFQLAIAALACTVATSAMATSTASYNLSTGTLATPSNTISADKQFDSTNASVGVQTSTWVGTSAAAYCTLGSAAQNNACSGGSQVGTNYGNSYQWNSTASVPGVTMSAFGTTGTTSGASFQKGYIGFYGGNGFGITSQSNGELVNTGTVGHPNMQPDSSSPEFQHAMDNVASYEEMLLSFTKSVTLSSISVGFEGGDSDATIFEYIGTVAPTITGKTWAQMLCTGSGVGTGGTNNCWKAVTNLLNLADGINNFSAPGAVSSFYWMVGAYVPTSITGLTTNIGTVGDDAFKLSGFAVTQATVPEPTSIALFGIAAAAFAASRRRRKA